jgi:hypothetical protein
MQHACVLWNVKRQPIDRESDRNGHSCGSDPSMRCCKTVTLVRSRDHGEPSDCLPNAPQDQQAGARYRLITNPCPVGSGMTRYPRASNHSSSATF